MSHPVRPGFSASTDDYGGQDSNERRQRGAQRRGKDPFRNLEENYILLQEALLADGGKLANADLGDINLVLLTANESPGVGNRVDPAALAKISTSAIDFPGVRGRAISVGQPEKPRSTVRASRALEKPSPRRTPARHSGPGEATPGSQQETTQRKENPQDYTTESHPNLQAGSQATSPDQTPPGR